MYQSWFLCPFFMFVDVSKAKTIQYIHYISSIFLVLLMDQLSMKFVITKYEPTLQYSGLYIERPICRSNIPGSHQDDIHQGPDPETSEAEEFSDPLLPVAEVEPVGSEASESDGESQGGVPAVALGPATLPPLAEHLVPETDGAGADGAVGEVPVFVAARTPCAATAKSFAGALVEILGCEETVGAAVGSVQPGSGVTRAENSLHHLTQTGPPPCRGLFPDIATPAVLCLKYQLGHPKPSTRRFGSQNTPYSGYFACSSLVLYGLWAPIDLSGLWI